MPETRTICYEIRLYAHVTVESDSDDDAIDIGERLLDSDEFREGILIPLLDDPMQWGDALGDLKMWVEHDSEEPTYLTRDEANRLIVEE